MDDGRGESAPRKTSIAGGFVLLTPCQLLMAWWCYREGLIRLKDLRVFLALAELVKRRSFAPDAKPRYRTKELERLVGGGGGPRRIRSSTKRLRKVGLFTSSETGELLLAKSPEELKVDDLGSLWDLLGAVKGTGRLIPIPRRMLRLLAGGASRAVIATALAHMIRCLFFTSGEVKGEGSCKASWVAQLFGVSHRAVVGARRHLVEELGWLEDVQTPQWFLNRYGSKVRVNLSWELSHVPKKENGKDASVESGQQDLGTKVAPLEEAEAADGDSLPGQSPVGEGGSFYPRKTDELTESVVSVSAGVPTLYVRLDEPPEVAVETEERFCETSAQEAPAVEARESGKTLELSTTDSAPLRPDFCTDSAPPLNKRTSSNEEDKNQKNLGATPSKPVGVFLSDGKGEELPPPSLKKILPEDLRDVERILELHKQASEIGWVTLSEADELKVVAVAERARTRGSENPCGLFRWLLQNRKFEFVTEDLEDAARKRLKEFHFGPLREEREVPREKRAAWDSSVLSADAKLVRAVEQAVVRTGFKGDPFYIAKNRDKSWTRERWEAASVELQAWKLAQRAESYRQATGSTVGELVPAMAAS